MMETDDDVPATEAGEPALASDEEDPLAAALGLPTAGSGNPPTTPHTETGTHEYTDGDSTDSDADSMDVDDDSDSDTHSTYNPLPSEPEDTLLNHPTTHDTSAPVPPPPAGTGHVDDDGVRRLGTLAEVALYGGWLEQNSLSVYSRLDPELQAMVRAYTEAEWPDLDRLRELDGSGVSDFMTAGLIDAVLRSDDPQAELDFWKEHAGIAERIATSDGGVYPTPARARELMALLDRAVDRPLPEGVETIRGLYDLAFMPGYEPKNPYQLTGTVYTDPGFMSVSLGGQPVKAQSAPFNHVIRFILPKGGHGLWLGGQSAYAEERESLLPGGTAFRVLRAGWGGSQGLSGFFIEAEILLPPGPGSETSSTP